MSKFTLHIGSAVFPSVAETREVDAGSTILQALEGLGCFQEMRGYLDVALEGRHVPEAFWGRVRPKAGKLVSVGIRPANDPTILRGISMLASVFGGELIGGRIGGLRGAIIGKTLQIAGIWATTTLIPPPGPEPSEDPTSQGFRNDVRRWGKVPRVYGRRRIYPPACAEPVLDVIGNDLYMRAIFALGQRPLHIVYDSIKLGETPISEFSGVEFEIRDGYFNYSTETFSLYSRDRSQQILNRELRWARHWRQNAAGVPEPGGTAGEIDGATELNRNVVELLTAPNCTEFNLDLTFPDGLGHQRGEAFDGWTVDLAVRYRPQGARGAGSWTDVAASAVDSQAYINEQLHPITGTDVFQWLEDINAKLDDLIVDLTAITTGERIVTEALFLFAQRRISEVQGILLGQIDSDTELTDEQLAIIESTQTKLDDLGVLMQTATRTTQAFTDDLINFNSYLTAAITALEIVDGALAVREYIRRGYGPEISNPILRFLMVRWKPQFAQIFGDPPTGSFRLINGDRAKGAIRKKITVPVAAGAYEVQVRRTSRPMFDQDTLGDVDPRYSDEYKERVELTAMVSIQQGEPISSRMRQRHAFMAVKVKLSNQIGSIDSLNMVVESPLPWYKDGEGWQPASLYDDQDRPVYKNPAWIACDIWRGLGNKRPAADAYIDTTRFSELAERCFTDGLYFSGVFEQRTTVERAVDDVLRVAKASRCMRYGQHSCVIDQPQATRVDVVTTRNSANTVVSRVYGQLPHALRIPFVNPDKGWADDELIVYDDTHGDPENPKTIVVTRPASGARIVIPYALTTVKRLVNVEFDYDVPFGSFHLEEPEDFPGTTWIVKDDGNWRPGDYRAYVVPVITEATRFETVDMPGLVDSHDQSSENHTGQVYALGRYLLKSARLRPETITTEMDFESLKFERGARVDVQHDVTLWGLGSGRLAADPVRNGGGDVTDVTLDTAFLMEADKSYQIRFRTGPGEFFDADVVTVAGENLSVELVTPLEADDLARGDLALWGETGEVSVECVVKDIVRHSDLTAQVMLIEHAPAIHDAAEEPIPEFDSHITIPPIIEIARPPMPETLAITTDESVLVRGADGTLQSRIRIAFRIPEGTTDADRAIAQAVTHVESQFRLRYQPTPASGLPVFYAPDAQNAWTNGGYFTRESGAVYIAPVQDGLTYDVRIRSVTRAGVPGDWNLTMGVLVVGKTSAPPDVVNLRVDGDELRWDYPAPPVDLAGFLVRQLRGEGGSWAMAAPAHDGVVGVSHFSLLPFPGGPREFWVKAVDTSGNESLTALNVSVIAGTVTPVDEVSRFEHRAEGWPGTATDMEVDTGDLVSSAGSMSGFYAGPGAPYYRGPSTAYYTTDYPFVAYEFDHVVDAGDLPYHLSIDIAAAGELWQIECKKVDAPFWPADLSQPLWPSRGDQPVWPDLEYNAYRGRIEAEEGVTYRFRVSALGSNTQLVITQLDEVITPATRAAS